MPCNIDIKADRVGAEIEAAIVPVSQRDFVRILSLLANPPEPNAKLRAAIAALPDTL